MMSDAAALPVAPAGVWVQLIVGNVKQGRTFRIKPTPEDVDALAKAVFPELTPREVAMCSVFAPGVDPKTGDALDPGDPVPGNTSSKNPLIVVAPEADGELRCCSRITVRVFEVSVETFQFRIRMRLVIFLP
jgi:hypothetical protein